MPLTLKDIAQMAGVSTATVSKVINGKDKDIGALTIERVKAIVEELDYQPNSLARSMKTKVTRTIGLIIPDVRNPFFTDLARGAEDCANDYGYSLLFCNTDDNLSKEMAYINTLTHKQVDGIALVGAVRRNQELEEKFNTHVPIVTLDRKVFFKGVRSHVHTDSVCGTYDAVQYLIDLGHRSIMFLCGRIDSNISVRRLEGYRRALEDNGIPYQENLVAGGSFTVDFGYQFVSSGQLPDGVTAIFCGNDLMALGAIKALKEQNKKVPEDMSIVGFDDIALASINTPSLTTVRQPSYDLGYVTVRRLIEILGGIEHKKKCLEIKLKLIPRESTAALKA